MANYRKYDEDGQQLLGRYGEIFEQEYMAELNEQQNMFNPDYMSYLGGIVVKDTHTGYFSIDKKGRAVNSETKRGSDTTDDISAYDLILKNKVTYTIKSDNLFQLRSFLCRYSSDFLQKIPYYSSDFLHFL